MLRLFAAPRLNIRKDYEKVRRMQSRFAALLMPPYRTSRWQPLPHDEHLHVPVRFFQPKVKRREDVLVFFHGGGWVTGDIDTYTPACVRMAELTGCAVASVNYRLAPEHPFPAGLEDCYGVARVLLDEPHRVGAADAGQVILVGDSAGGNFAAVISLLLRERGYRPPDRQILIYPVTHWDHDPDTSPFASVRSHGGDYRLTNAEVEDYFDLYVPDRQQRRDPHVAPLLAPDLSGHPATLVITAELDLLRDEGEAYGRALADAGNTVQTYRVEGALHGFISLPRFSQSVQDAYEVINAFLDGDPVEGGHCTPREAI
ncbi:MULTISPECIES: alpha/beta hydrolase [Brevibacterium]|uniref:Acetyl esterase/lipase n=2 Tax=Brevibacterium TaxID=1696 RepID=A0A1H1V5E9_BRESA|nr:alpha/beta hydrolase [Brevibacterium sandarakinum]SDS79840.1 Acetyl esterase/lipase [Brevibacterium sandarakinum]